MRTAKVFVHGDYAGVFSEIEKNQKYSFIYDPQYKGPPISLTMPRRQEPYSFSSFPAFFDGLLPEGEQLIGLLRHRKLDRLDYFAQLMAVGHDLVGAVTLEEIHDKRENGRK